MQLITAPKYVKYPECKEGDVLVNNAKFVGTKQGKFGAQHYFEELESGERVCLNSSGQLNYLVEEHLIPGRVCKVVYKGKVTLTKKAMSGKEAHNFDMYLDKIIPTATEPTVSNDSTNIDDLA